MLKISKFVAITAAIDRISAATVLTENGPVVGDHVPADLSLNAAIVQPVDQYLGIPFAQPPVGELRFRPPQPLTDKWEAPRDCSVQPPACISASEGQEDCLYLNVYVPSTPSATPRAVMLWIYGGGYKSGSISVFNGTALAASEDVIVVMGNYRLGVLGFLSNDGTFAESGTTGNWGLLDQRAVMMWVQANIGAFGGNPDRVTVFGESAGAMSVIAHLVNEESAKLFDNAIIQSGTSKVEMFFQPRADADKYNDWFTRTHLNCPNGVEDMECLRRVPATRFNVRDSERDGWGAPTWSNPIFPLFGSSPVIDGVFLTASPHDMLAGGSVSWLTNKAIILGTTQDEGTVFTTQLHTCVRPQPQFPPTEADMAVSVQYMVQDQRVADKLLDEFPKYQAFYADLLADPSTPDFRFAEFLFISDMIRNVMFACPTTSLGDLLATAGLSVFMYNFAFNFWPAVTRDVPIGKLVSQLGNMTVSELGAFHSSDVPFVLKQFLNRNITLNDITADAPFALYMAPAFSKPTDASHQVSDAMSCYWTNLAKCDSPNCPGSSCGITWEAFNVDTRNFLLFEPLGTLKMDSIASSGELVVGASFPSMDTCNWYMQNIHTPFHDLRADLDLAQTLPNAIDHDKHATGLQVGLFALIAAVVVAGM